MKAKEVQRRYQNAIEALREHPSFEPTENLDSEAEPLLYGVERGEKVYFLFKKRYPVAIQKTEEVKAWIQIPGKRYMRTDFSFAAKPTLRVVDPTLKERCLENREKVLNEVIRMYGLSEEWNDKSAFHYLLVKTIRSEEDIDDFINALQEWAYNDPMA
jgi:hypothetical protein